MLRPRTTSAGTPRKYLIFSGLLLIVATYVITTGINLQFGGCQYNGFPVESQNNLQDRNTAGKHRVTSADVASTTIFIQQPTTRQDVHTPPPPPPTTTATTTTTTTATTTTATTATTTTTTTATTTAETTRLYTTAFATEATIFNQSVHSTSHHLFIPVTNFTSGDTQLLSNLSSKTTEFKEYPGYFENFTYFYLNSSRVSDISSQYSIPGTSVCSGDVDLLVMVMSVRNDGDGRLLIRQTWASPIYDNSWSQKGLVRLVFFFGNEGFTDAENLALHNESKLFGDIVVASFKDSYGNLSLKLATALTWASKHCPHAKFVAKVDMDTFAHLQVLLKFLQSLAHNYTNFIVGYQHGYDKPFVVRDGRWAVPKDVYAYSYFPKYIYGHSYVISGPAVHKMAASFPFVHIVPNEDAFITGIMAVTLNITRLGNAAFAFGGQKYTFCDLVYRRYATTMYNVKYMKELWDAMLTGNCTETPIT